MTTSDILKHAYVISDSDIRLDQFRKTLTAVGIDPSPIRVWEACRIPNEGWMGCNIAHYSVVRYAMSADLPWLVVFEDDAVPRDDAAAELVKAFENRKPDTLCLTLGWSYDSDPELGEDATKHRRIYGSQAYALFGKEAYKAYIDYWHTTNGLSDVVINKMAGAKINGENLFAQHTPKGGEGIHLPSGWTAGLAIEQAVNKECKDRFTKAKAAIAEAEKKIPAVHVAYCIDVQGTGAAQFSDQLYVSVKSVRDTKRPEDNVVVHVMYANVSVELMERLHALDGDGFKVKTRHITDQDLTYWQQFTRHDPKSAARPWGGIVFARIWLPLFLKDCDRCIYLDADTMARAPISDLYRGEIPEGKWLGMNMGSVPEYGYNSGVMLMDLKSMREDKDLYKRLVEFMAKNTRSFYCPDQTTINRFFADKIADIGREWNYPPTTGCADPEMAKAKIWHFYNGSTKPYRIAGDDWGRALVLWNRVLE